MGILNDVYDITQIHNVSRALDRVRRMHRIHPDASTPEFEGRRCHFASAAKIEEAGVRSNQPVVDGQCYRLDRPTR